MYQVEKTVVSLMADNLSDAEVFRVVAVPGDVRESDLIAGLFVESTKKNAEHQGRPAVQFDLSTEPGGKSVGRLTLVTGTELEMERVVVGVVDASSLRRQLSHEVPEGVVVKPARAIMPGDVLLLPASSESPTRPFNDGISFLEIEGAWYAAIEVASIVLHPLDGEICVSVYEEDEPDPAPFWDTLTRADDEVYVKA